MKTCSKCNQTLDESEFYKNSKTRDGLQAWCKKCSVANRLEHYQSNKNHERKRNKSYVLRNRNFVRTYKETNPCVQCGEKRWYVLDFHHIKDKDSHIADLVTRGVSLKTLRNEIGKCIVLCSNCHREVHFKNNNGGVAQ